MSDMVPEVLNAALDSLFTPKEPGEQEYQGVDGLLYCRNCHTPVQCRVKLCPEQYLPIVEGAIDGALKIEKPNEETEGV